MLSDVYLEVADNEILLSVSAALRRLTILLSSPLHSRFYVLIFNGGRVVGRRRCYWHSTTQYRTALRHV